MGEILFEKFAKVQKYVHNLTEDQRSGIRETVFWCDDDTWDEYRGKPKRKNYVGAHLFMSAGSLAVDQGKGERTLQRWLVIWEKAGWFARQEDVRALDGNMTYANYVRSRPKTQHPTSRVFNVSMLCRLLDVRETVLSNKLRMGRDKELEALIDFALQVREDDFENPPIRAIKDYKPRLIDDWMQVAQEGPPDRWEDLYEAKKESAGEGASVKVKTDSERTSESTDQLSSIDVITSDDEFAKVVDDLFPFTVSILRDDDDFVIEFLPEHINEQGQLDIDRVGVEDEIKEEFFDLDSGPVWRVEQFSESNAEVLLAVRKYLDKQRE